MNKIIVAIGQITVGVIVGNVAYETMDKLVVKPVKKYVKSKKEGV